jgi:hypothetical protein
MKNGKKKSSGWQPSRQRRTPAEHQARYFARRAETGQHESDRLGRWRGCPVRQCRRVGHCNTEELQCERRPRRAAPPARNTAPRPSDPAATTARPAAPVMTATEAAAAIKASIAAEPPDAFNRDDLEALKRAGLI